MCTTTAAAASAAAITTTTTTSPAAVAAATTTGTAVAVASFSAATAAATFWSTISVNREQRGYQKSDPDEDQYYVGCLGQSRVWRDVNATRCPWAWQD